MAKAKDVLWTPAREDQLVHLWDKKLPVSEIVMIMGAGFNRNKVIGKAWRMNLSKPRPAPKPITTPHKVFPVLPADPPPEERKTFEQIGVNDCRYPMGDPQDQDFAYCGRKAMRGSYCEHHHERCHRKEAS